MAAPNVQLSSDGYAVVDKNYHLLDAKRYPPPKRGVMLCGNVETGKTVISKWNTAYGFTHWAPLPVFNRQ